MNPLSIVKTATELVVSAGAAAVVGNAIKQSTPASTKTYRKIMIGVGGFVLSGMVGEMASNYAIKSIDNGLDQYKQAKDVVTDALTDPELRGAVDNVKNKVVGEE